MKKSLALIIAAALVTVTLYSSEDDSKTYFGYGFGNSRYKAAFRYEEYYIDENDGYKIKSYDKDDKGYKLYAGYKLDESIAFEISYTDYGTFVASQRYTQKPKSLALSTNIGHDFFNEQLRPFALLGLGYLKTDESRDVLANGFVIINFGAGIEYYPIILKGIGFRAVYERNFRVTAQEAVDESGENYSMEFFAHTYHLSYIGVQYKF